MPTWHNRRHTRQKSLIPLFLDTLYYYHFLHFLVILIAWRCFYAILLLRSKILSWHESSLEPWSFSITKVTLKLQMSLRYLSAIMPISYHALPSKHFCIICHFQDFWLVSQFLPKNPELFLAEKGSIIYKKNKVKISLNLKR